MTAGIIESIHFTKTPGTCENGSDHSQYAIQWIASSGCQLTAIAFWCNHPFCDFTPLRLFDSPPFVLHTKFIPGPVDAVAVAYFLLIEESGKLPHVEARIGICSQWQDRARGNYGHGERRLFTERYFAESGPGVYPAPITTVASDGVNASVNP